MKKLPAFTWTEKSFFLFGIMAATLFFVWAGMLHPSHDEIFTEGADASIVPPGGPEPIFFPEFETASPTPFIPIATPTATLPPMTPSTPPLKPGIQVFFTPTNTPVYTPTPRTGPTDFQ